MQDECDPSTSRIQILIGDKSLDTTHFVPRSIALVKPPVCRDRWNLRSKLRRCSNVSRATLLTAFCPTLAKTAFSSSVKSVAPIRAAPSAREEEESLYIVTRVQLNKKEEDEHPRMSDPARTHTVDSCVISTFNESIISLNINGTCTLSTYRSPFTFRKKINTQFTLPRCSPSR